MEYIFLRKDMDINEYERLFNFKLRHKLKSVWRCQGVIRIRISEKNRKHNGQMKKYKRTNGDLQKHTHRTKDRVTQTPLKTGDELRCFGREGSKGTTLVLMFCISVAQLGLQQWAPHT